MAENLPHSLSCPQAGQWLLLFFRKKVNKKLSPAPDAIKVSALANPSLPHQPRANLSLTNVCALA
jgi:hypothetical protein